MKVSEFEIKDQLFQKLKRGQRAMRREGSLKSFEKTVAEADTARNRN